MIGYGSGWPRRSDHPDPCGIVLVGVTLVAAVLTMVIPLAALGGVFSTEDPFGLADPAEFQAELDAALAAVALPAGRTWPDLPRFTPSSRASAPTAAGSPLHR